MEELQNYSGELTQSGAGESGAVQVSSEADNPWKLSDAEVAAGGRPVGFPPFGIKDKVGYALGDFGCNLSFALITTYLVDFYTQYIGLTEVTWAVIIVFLKVWDAINDPIMGAVIDSKRISKKSRYKPWIRIGSFGLIVSGALAFLPIPNANYVVKVIVCVATYLSWDIFYTLVNVPYGTMNSTISPDPNHRTALSTFRSIGAGAGGLVTVILPMIVYDSNNNLIGERFIWIGLIMGAVAFVAYQLCLKMTTERLDVEPPKQKYNYLKTLKRMIGNRPLIAMCVASFAMIVFVNSHMQTTKWVFQAFFQNAQLVTVVTIVTNIPMVLMIFFAGKLTKKFGKKPVILVPLIVSAVAALIFMFVPMNANSIGGPITYIVALFFINIGGGVFALLCWAMITDCIDYHEIKTGVREEGSVYAIYSLFRKLAQGVSASLVILCMTWVGYEAARGADQAAGVGENMKNMALLLMLIGLILMIVCMLFIYNINKKMELDMREKLGRAASEIDINAALENRND